MRLSVYALAVSLVALSVPAKADVKHTVARGHTVEAIAARYRVTAKSIIEANHLKDVKHIQPGDVLTIPGVEPSKGADAKHKGAKDKTDAKAAKLGDAKRAAPPTYAAKPKTPGVIHLKRIGTAEEQDIRVADERGKVPPSSAKSVEKLLRSQSGVAHPIDARLVALLGVVSNHFGSRKIEVVSGFRPYTPTQYTAHSNHNHGKAIDFRVVGVPNEAVRDFCRTLKNVGCGYYPNSTFVHMDVRTSSAFWIDYAKPGEPPRYNAPNVDADEGTSDVHASAGPTQSSTPEAGKPAEEDKTGAPVTSPAPAAEPAPEQPMKVDAPASP